MLALFYVFGLLMPGHLTQQKMFLIPGAFPRASSRLLAWASKAHSTTLGSKDGGGGGESDGWEEAARDPSLAT